MVTTKCIRLRVAVTLAMAALAATLLVLVATVKPAEAAFPGKNGKIVFESGRSGYVDIYAMNPDGTGLKRLTTDGNAETNPAVSPNGSKIAYEFFRGIWTMNADGSAKKRLTDGTLTDRDPTWSADGTKIAFTRILSSGDWEIFVMNADGTGLKNLTNTPSNQERDPAFSPNGTKIAYTRGGCENPNAGGTCVYVMNSNGTQQTNLTPEDRIPQCLNQPGYNHRTVSQHASWSPDGTKIAFRGTAVCPHTSGLDIWVMNADGSGKKNLINDNQTSDDKPAFSPNSTKIAFASNRSGNWEIYSMNADGSGSANLTTNTARDDAPDWQPNSPPTVTNPRPAPNSETRNRKPTIAATVKDKQTNLSKSTITLYVDGKVISRSAFSYDRVTDRLSYTPASNLAFGKHIVKIVARDEMGLGAAKSWSFKVVR